MNKKSDNCYFRTSSFYTSVFLFCKDQTLVNVDKITDFKRAQFVFLDSPELELLLQNYNYSKEDSPEAMVDARKFVTAIRTLKNMLYQEKF